MRVPGALLILAFTASAVSAQTVADERDADGGTPRWMEAWSPLRPIADQARTLSRAPELPQLLLIGGPRIGQLWTVGNPAGLAYQVGDSRAELRGAWGRDDGSYRRPLDDLQAGALQLYGLGWQPLGKGAAVGRVIFDQQRAQPGSFADVIEGYPSNPFVVTDTSVPDLRRVRARLEGGFGWQFGAWGLGLTVGVEVRDHRTTDARFPRLSRASTPSASLGLFHDLPLGMRLAAYGRWVGNRESITLVGQPGTGLVYQLEGYAEPSPREVVPPNVIYLRRLERNGFAGGLALSGELWGSEWVLFWERHRRDERHFSELRTQPRSDEWEARGSRLAGALQWPFLSDGRLRLTAYAEYSALDGDARRFDLEGIIFRANESVFLTAADIRYMPPGSPWAAALVLRLAGESRLRQDFIAETWTEIDSWTPGAAAEVAWTPGRSTALSVGFGFAAYSATSTLPNPELMGPVYQRLIAPELSLYATRAATTTLGLSLRQQVGSRTALLLRGHWESLSASGNESPLPFAPTGDRVLLRLSLSLVLKR